LLFSTVEEFSKSVNSW